jgi:hypothetical protein
MKNPVPPLSNPITDQPVGLTWSAYFTNLKLFIDNLASNIAIRIHNDLEQLQGGTTTERYHLDQTQYTAVGHLPTFNGDSTQYVNGLGVLAVPSHANLGSLQGGAAGEYYHVNLINYNKINQYPVLGGNAKTYLAGNGLWSTPKHNDLAGLNIGNYQHLTPAQVSSISNIDSLIFGYMSLGL